MQQEQRIIHCQKKGDAAGVAFLRGAAKIERKVNKRAKPEAGPAERGAHGGGWSIGRAESAGPVRPHPLPPVYKRKIIQEKKNTHHKKVKLGADNRHSPNDSKAVSDAISANQSFSPSPSRTFPVKSNSRAASFQEVPAHPAPRPIPFRSRKDEPKLSLFFRASVLSRDRLGSASRPHQSPKCVNVAHL